MKRFSVSLVMIVMLSCIRVIYGLADEELGPDSVRGHPTTAQSDWPVGIVEVPRHESRVYSTWVNGNEDFYFKATPHEINELIRLFSRARMRDYTLCLRFGTPSTVSFKGSEISYNVHLNILGGLALGHYRTANKIGETYEPTLTVYFNPTDSAFLGQMELPDNIILDSLIVYHPVKGKSTKPDRKVWYAEVQFDDSTPAVDFRHMVFTAVTLWEEDVETGIKLGMVDHEGFLTAAFSEKEIADLKAGKSWLTLTVGNLQTEAQRDHLRLSVNNLALDKHQAEPVKINKPKFYYGRILFEDGSPPLLDPVTWGHAKIQVNFDHTGPMPIDSDGYFRVYLTKEQYGNLKTKKSERNIIIPDYGKRNSATSLFVFPVSKLSLEKEEAGVVKIPQPSPSKKVESQQD